MKRYEGMFLFDNSVAHEWATIEAEVRRLCDRIDAQLQVCVKYDERKLAYEIQRRKRGTFVLTYFDAPAERIADMERDARLSESILRLLVLRADKVPAERIAELQAHPAETPLSPGGGEGRRHYYDDRPRRDRDRPPRGRDGAREEARKPEETGEKAETADKPAEGTEQPVKTDATPEAAEPQAVVAEAPASPPAESTTPPTESPAE